MYPPLNERRDMARALAAVVLALIMLAIFLSPELLWLWLKTLSQ